MLECARKDFPDLLALGNFQRMSEPMPHGGAVLIPGDNSLFLNNVVPFPEKEIHVKRAWINLQKVFKHLLQVVGADGRHSNSGRTEEIESYLVHCLHGDACELSF